MNFKLELEKPNGEKLEFNIDVEEMDYIVQQIKFNQPFVVVLDKDIFAFSPSQMLSIKISEL